jgi:hypothetical protein
VQNRGLRRGLRIIWMALLIGLLTACSGNGPGPSSQIVQQAIVMEIETLQRTLMQQLNLDMPATFKIQVRHVQIQDQDSLSIETLPSIHLRGTYDVTIKLPTQTIEQHTNPFDLYLQRQIEGKSWRLAHPNQNKTWSTELVTPS